VAVNDVDIHLHLRAEHADRVEDAGLVIHLEMLPDRVDDAVLHRQIDRLGVLDHILHVSPVISRSAETTGWTPWLLNPRMWLPVTPR